MRCLDDPSNCLYTALRSSHGTAVTFLRIPTNMSVCVQCLSSSCTFSFERLFSGVRRVIHLEKVEPEREQHPRGTAKRSQETNVPPHSGSVVESKIFDLN